MNSALLRVWVRSVRLSLPLMAASVAVAQTGSRPDTAARATAPGIQDNSFLCEEAYNQAPGVVQHIFTFTRDQRSPAAQLTFVQEWPVGGMTHQLSYGVTLVRDGGPSGAGLGDLRLNYRYQLAGDGDAAVAVAPRFTAILPTGDYRRGRGAGAVGLETWLPVSVVVANRFVAHANLGLTLTPHARDAQRARATTHDWTAGGSVVWLAHSRVNFLVEVLYQRHEDVIGTDATDASSQVTISPGVRWAYNFAAGLQIVPGLAFPLGAGPSHGQRSALAYLSFEHAFTTAARSNH